MRKLLWGLFVGVFLCGSVLPVFGQGQFKIYGSVSGITSPTAYLAEMNAGRVRIIDSVGVSGGRFAFTESTALPYGLYYVILNSARTQFFQLLLNKEDIECNTAYNSITESMQINGSPENLVMYAYIKQLEQANNRTAELQKNGNLTPGQSAEINNLNAGTMRLAQKIIAFCPGTLLADILRAEQPVPYPAGMIESARQQYLTEHFFDNVNFTDTFLIRTYVLSSLMNNYLARYESKSFTQNEQVENYVIAADSILSKTKNYPPIHNFYLKELEDKFRYGDYDVVCAWLEEQNGKPVDACEAETTEHLTLREQLARMKHASVGTKAPEVAMPTYDGKVAKMTDIGTEYTLIVFWSTFCYHCTQVLPQLKELYDHRKTDKLEVLALSVDTDQKQWQDFIKQGGYSWINYCDLKGWESTIPKSYNVQGTPTFILLNKDKTIISKPATIEALAQKLKDMNIL